MKNGFAGLYALLLFHIHAEKRDNEAGTLEKVAKNRSGKEISHLGPIYEPLRINYLTTKTRANHDMSLSCLDVNSDL